MLSLLNQIVVKQWILGYSTKYYIPTVSTNWIFPIVLVLLITLKQLQYITYLVWIATYVAKKRLLYNFKCLFSYNPCIPEYVYTNLYTIISNKIIFQWLFLTECIPKPVFTSLYTASSLFCSQMPTTNGLFWCILVLYHFTKIMFGLVLTEKSFWSKLHIISRKTFHIQVMLSFFVFVYGTSGYLLMFM